MRVLGISAFYHDSAAAITENGLIAAAAQEERFTRVKHDASFPVNAIRACLREADLEPRQLDYVVFYEKPFLKFERLIETYLANVPNGFKSFAKSMPVWLTDKLFQKRNLINHLNLEVESGIDWSNKLLFSEHHLSHAASAFYPSPFESAAILTMDGVGEWPTTSMAVGEGTEIKILKEIHFPHSLGLLYSAFTYFTGFKVNSGEYKIMGLAPYGEPRYSQIILDNLIEVKKDGSFRLNMAYFDFATGLRMTNEKFANLFDGPARSPESKITQREMDLAASIQVVTEEIVLRLGEAIRGETGNKNLCLAGGVALNCVANGALVRKGTFDNVWIQPASGDAGGAIGAALAINYLRQKTIRRLPPRGDAMQGSYLGNQYTQNEIERCLFSLGAKFTVASQAELIQITAQCLTTGMTVGWFQGRMEFGPRALGNRSILADPRNPNIQRELNLKIKFRESFRPFAPSVLIEHLSSWFELDIESPYMLLVSDIKREKRVLMTNEQQNLFGIDKLNIPRSEIPAVTHVDYSARVQTVHTETNSLFHALLTEFHKITGCPVLVNTSFNVRGEPIVESPKDAFRCFMGSDLDLLVIGNSILYKSEQRRDKAINYLSQYGKD